MSVIYCQVCDKYVDTDFDVEHENECGKDAVECEFCHETIYYNESDTWPDSDYNYIRYVECAYCRAEQMIGVL